MTRTQVVIVVLGVVAAALIWLDSVRGEWDERRKIVRPHRYYVRLPLAVVCPDCEALYEPDVNESCPACASRAKGYEARAGIEPLAQAAQKKAKVVRTGKLKVFKGERR